MIKATSERGFTQSIRIGDIVVTYRTGEDSPLGTPVYDMSVGRILLEDHGSRPKRILYSVPHLFFEGHVFEFGARQEKRWSYPLVDRPAPEDVGSFLTRPGKKASLSRQDYLGLRHRLGAGYFLDGTMRTSFRGTIDIDGVTHTLAFGPHTFVVEQDRNWAEEQAWYLEFFEARDRGQIQL